MEKGRLTSLQADEVLDTYGLLCPLPIVKTAEKVKELRSGTILEVLSTDGGIELDMKNWCRSHEHEYLGCLKEGKVFRVFLRIGAKK